MFSFIKNVPKLWCADAGPATASAVPMQASQVVLMGSPCDEQKNRILAQRPRRAAHRRLGRSAGGGQRALIRKNLAPPIELFFRKLRIVDGELFADVHAALDGGPAADVLE